MIKKSVFCSVESIEKDLQQQDFVSAAVLLSPPRQRDGLLPAVWQVWQDLSVDTL